MPNAGNAHLAPVRWAGRRGSTPPGARGSLERERAVLAAEARGGPGRAMAAAARTSAAGRPSLPARDRFRRRPRLVPRRDALGRPWQLDREQIHRVGSREEPVWMTLGST